MTKPTRQELLEHYATKQPRRFYQIDAYRDSEIPEQAGQPDEPGVGYIFATPDNWELMDGATVRLLIKPGTPKTEVLTLLGEIIAILESWEAGSADLPGSELNLIAEIEAWLKRKREEEQE